MSGAEIVMEEADVIVSKTDLKGRITYANDIFRRISGYSESDLLDAPHSIVRHPDMPRCVFKLLWDTLETGDEIFAYVKNLCKNGDFYWVHAHVTPSQDEMGRTVAYHSNRRRPDRDSVEKIEIIYKFLLEIEQSIPNSKDGMAKSFDTLVRILTKLDVTYDQFIFEFTTYFSKAELEAILPNFR